MKSGYTFFACHWWCHGAQSTSVLINMSSWNCLIASGRRYWYTTCDLTALSLHTKHLMSSTNSAWTFNYLSDGCAVRTGIVFGRVCLSVCLSDAQKLKNYRPETAVTWQPYVPRWTLKVIRFKWHLTLTFDVDVRIFWIKTLSITWQLLHGPIIMPFYTVMFSSWLCKSTSGSKN